MNIAGNYATMQLPIESLKNIQAFYLFIPQFQNMKFIYSSLQRKSCSRCCSYISIMWAHVVIQNYLSPRVSLTPISSAKYLPVSFFVDMHVSYCYMFRFCTVSAVESFVRCNSTVSHFLHLHNSLSIRPSLGISEEEFLSLFASVVSLSPLQKRLILRLALGRGLALLVRVGASSVSLPSERTLK